MNSVTPERRKILVIVGASLIGLILVGIVLTLLFNRGEENRYGESLQINNFSQEVENVSGEFEEAVEAYLYNILERNVQDGNLEDIRDIFIRVGSVSQSFQQSQNYYSGSFLLDIASIQHTYRVQYDYSSDPNNPFVPGNSSVITCPEPDDLIYGPFACVDFTAEESIAQDPFLAQLPYRSLSFDVLANQDEAGEALSLIVDLRIPSVNLRGSDAERRQAIATYKRLVTSWIEDQGATPSDYEIRYNYSDAGQKINNR